jgi:hypothetical protein
MSWMMFLHRDAWIGLLSAVVLVTLAGCGKSDESTASGGTTAGKAQVTAKGGAILGRAATRDGRPLKKFTVEYGGFPVGKIGAYDANGRLMDAAGGSVEGKDGRYEIKVPDGQYGTEATVTAQWHDRPFTFQLEADDGKQSTTERVEVTSSKGLVRNYVWNLTGPRPGRDQKDEGSGWSAAVYGPTLWLDCHEGEMRAGQVTDRGLYADAKDADVEVTLTPRGKLVDGSEGKVVVARVPVVRSGTYSGGVRDIPLGDYSVTAKLVDKSGKELRPLRLSLSKGKTSADYKGYAVDWKPSVDVAFDTPYERPIHYLGAKAQTVYVGR